MQESAKEPKVELPEGMAEALQEAELAWRALLDASLRIKEASRTLQKLGAPHSHAGYLIERAHWKHKPDHIRNHLQGIQKFMEERGVELKTDLVVG
jgi:hypothetical protein